MAGLVARGPSWVRRLVARDPDRELGEGAARGQGDARRAGVSGLQERLARGIWWQATARQPPAGSGDALHPVSNCERGDTVQVRVHPLRQHTQNSLAGEELRSHN